MFDVKLDPHQLEKVESALSQFPDKFPKAVAFAVNRSLAMTKTEQMRRTTAMYTVARGKLAESINVFNASPGNLVGKINSKGGMIGLDHFKLNPKTRRKTMVSAVVKKGEGGDFPHAFIPYFDGRLGAFERSGNFKKVVSKSGKITSRETIKRIMGLSAPQMLGEMSILDYLQGFMEEKFNMRIDYELGRIFE